MYLGYTFLVSFGKHKGHIKCFTFVESKNYFCSQTYNVDTGDLNTLPILNRSHIKQGLTLGKI